MDDSLTKDILEEREVFLEDFQGIQGICVGMGEQADIKSKGEEIKMMNMRCAHYKCGEEGHVAAYCYSQGN